MVLCHRVIQAESQASGWVGADRLRWGRARRTWDVDQATVRVAPRAAAHSRLCAMAAQTP